MVAVSLGCPVRNNSYCEADATYFGIFSLIAARATWSQSVWGVQYVTQGYMVAVSLGCPVCDNSYYEADATYSGILSLIASRATWFQSAWGVLYVTRGYKVAVSLGWPVTCMTTKLCGKSVRL